METLAQALYHASGLNLHRVEQLEYGIWEESFPVWTDRGRRAHIRPPRFDRLPRRVARQALPGDGRLGATGRPVA